MVSAKLMVSMTEKLLGPSGFIGMTRTVKPNVRKFVECILVNTWAKYKKATAREVRKLELDLKRVDKEWESKSITSLSFPVSSRKIHSISPRTQGLRLQPNSERPESISHPAVQSHQNHGSVQGHSHSRYLGG
jgi:hypothetical protein